MDFRSLTLLLLIATSSSAFSPSYKNGSAIHHLLHRDPSPKQIIRQHERLEQNLSRDCLTLLHATKNKILIVYGTSTGSTETVADMIAAEFGSDAEGPIEIDGIHGSLAKKFADFDAIIVGTPTWNTGADTERSGTGWDEIYYDEMQDLNISGKKVAVFGLGDQISYSENYADASGELHDVFKDLGCEMMGYTSYEGYEHESSKAVRGDKFCGLLCDMVNEDDLSEGRVKNWVSQLKAEGILEVASESNTAGLDTETVTTVTLPTTNTSSNHDAAQDITEVTAVPSAIISSSHDAAEAIAELKRENARLREMLEENSLMLDGVLGKQDDRGFTPHYNLKTQRTMWTSQDGQTCFYTVKAPKGP